MYSQNCCSQFGGGQVALAKPEQSPKKLQIKILEKYIQRLKKTK
jgi:hypothetical protein